MHECCQQHSHGNRMDELRTKKKETRKSKKREYGNKIDIQLRSFDGLAIEETPEALLTRSCG